MINTQIKLGAICSPKDVRDYKGVCTTTIQFPQEYESYVPDVKNQGNVGSCVAHSLAEVIEYFTYKQENKKASMSTGFIYGNRINSNHKDSGMIVRDALKAVANNGTTKYEDFPYNIEVPEAIEKFNNSLLDLEYKAYPNKISSYYLIISDAVLKASIMNGDAVIFAIPWYRDIEVVNGVIKTKAEKGNYDGHHCMVIYGWNKDGWLIQNSWGTDWGKDGRAILPYNIPRNETWGIRDTVSNEEGKRQWIQKATTKIDELELTLTTLEYNIDELELKLFSVNDPNYKGPTEEELRKDIEIGLTKLTDVEHEISTLRSQIAEVKTQLVKINKPFNTSLGSIIARILNFILKYFLKK